MADEEPLANGFVTSDEQNAKINGASHEELDQAQEPLANGDAEAAVNHESPLSVSQGSPSEDEEEVAEALNPEAIEKRGLAVIVPPVVNSWEYAHYQEPSKAIEILEDYDDEGFIEYLVRFDDESEEVLTFELIRQLDNCRAMLEEYQSRGNEHSDSESESSSSESIAASAPRATRRTADLSSKHISNFILSSDDELTILEPSTRRGRPSRQQGHSQSQVSMASSQQPTRELPARTTRAGAQKPVDYSDVLTLEEEFGDDSSDDLQLVKGKRNTQGASSFTNQRLPRRTRQRNSSSDEITGNRRSERNIKQRNMRELGEEDIPEKALTISSVPKFVGAKESFQQLPEDDEFRQRHYQSCDTCNEQGDHEVKGVLVYCQGCTISYHKKCLGPRNGREHLVTKIGDKDFVLQCRRCIGISKQKDPYAPDHGLCWSCGDPGDSTSPFRDRKTTREEQKEREENDGADPITDVTPESINNADNLLFRCLVCYRGCHFYHLPLKGGIVHSTDLSNEELASIRFADYSTNWGCKECVDAPADVDSLVAWRPVNVDRYEPGQSTDQVPSEMQEYLVKWKKLPYTKAQWMPGAWVWGVTVAAMRKAFAKRNNNNNLPKMSTEDAIPEEFMRTDIVLDVEYTNVVKEPSEKVAKARIKEVRKSFVKFKGLGYEDAAWTEPPAQEDTERWEDFQTAYNEWVIGSFVRPPGKRDLETRLTKVRSQNFKDNLALEKQPEALTGGELMKYQLDGLNWIYYQWFKRQNAILADEMGLGKTIQVIGFLATLKETHGCWPFLVVVPNSTCPNWRREIKRWAPSLRVVTFYGSAEARRLAMNYELFPTADRQLRCHVVVTSYETAQDEDFRKVFRGVHWAGLVVDEGQRLKSDKNILYHALSALKAPFKLLLTGTPLQNNARELFNLLQFLDQKINAQAMEQEYATLTEENIATLHAQLRDIFLRRTKADVLKFLPSMAQIILPVTMSVLQKKLYKSILSQNPELIKSIIGTKKLLGAKERANLNNILMQLRKCLAHPFVYNSAIEERSSNPTTSHRNLVDASSKLQLLEIMLPKLQERGHRVLIFSQFLDMLNMVEDFLDGLGLLYQRLDGSIGSLQKQKRIDEFNAPDSNLFAFLLSTRAGGVGINLATADTVIILDPDFNPHQDIQALSRAHRLGQNKKVLVFQLTTRATAEEKIMQIGKRKMALDHIMIEHMATNEDAGVDVESILKHGTDALFKDDDTQDIRYDSASVDRLLDRSQVEDTQTNENKSAESQFSFARVWANEKGALEEGMAVADEPEPDPSVWDDILKQREREAAEAAAAKEQDLGRGRRKRQTVDYTKQIGHGKESSPAGKRSGKRSQEADSDTDFLDHGDDSDDAVESAGEIDDEYLSTQKEKSRHAKTSPAESSPAEIKEREFKRAVVPEIGPDGYPLPPYRQDFIRDPVNDVLVVCYVCDTIHIQGFCPLKLAGVELCPLCGIAHFGLEGVCPHLNSVTQCRLILDALKKSPEKPEDVARAKKYILSKISELNKKKREKVEEKRLLKEAAAQNVQSLSANGAANGTANGTANGASGHNGVVDHNSVASGYNVGASSNGVQEQQPYQFGQPSRLSPYKSSFHF